MSSKSRHKRVGPEYPTREALLAVPGVLREHLPAGWKRMVAAGGVAVVFTVAGLGVMPAGCTRDTGGPAAIVAPIFEHGDGRAATGCVVVSPPVFISEEEARQIITEELGKAGVKFTQKDVEMKRVMIKHQMARYVEANGKSATVMEEFKPPTPLVVDLVDPERKVAVEFISQADYHDVGGGMSMSTVEDYDFKEVGRGLAEKVKAVKGGYRVGVFYDPAGHGEIKMPTEEELKGKNAEERSKMYLDMREAGQAGAAKSAKENLRLQVRDFAEWLKKQGVI
jgi:hypothetical protein